MFLAKSSGSHWVNEEGKFVENSLSVNEQVEEEVTTGPVILHFFGQRKFFLIREKSGNFEKGCLWQP